MTAIRSCQMEDDYQPLQWNMVCVLMYGCFHFLYGFAICPAASIFAILSGRR
jgi:hypothetical protein